MPLPSRVTLLAALLLLPLTACADPQGAGPLAAPPASDTPTPGAPTSAAPRLAQPATPPSGAFTPPLSRTLPPSLGTPPKPPKPTPPTDLRPTDTIAGHVTRGGAGPCYGLVAEDGRAYALHGPGYGNLTEGNFVTLRIASRSSDIDCGPGIRVSIVAP
ncbi:hypothetical protein LADH09A_000812 [Micromonospora sp. LAH09]|uniref:hypothetical protein n=1 Tax=Micromonospora cabrerizensis TaxID=2911213 RepID=UPI001EE7B544|nr:hypothetical protein [Micromonospora cabrerizensis]MCG5472932.1 hypothetical protein [Micromonospora cabrerizensis]